MFNSQESRVNRSQGLKKEKEGTFKNLDLAAVQCNGIAVCAYFFKRFVVHTLLCLTVDVDVRCPVLVSLMCPPKGSLWGAVKA